MPDRESEADSGQRRALLILLAVLALAAALRFWGLDYGLPHPLVRPDEERVVGRAQTIFATGDWHPGSFFYPSLPFYLGTLALWAYYLFHHLLGTYDRPFDFLFDVAVLRPGLHYAICRSVSALAGTLTVAATYFLSMGVRRDRAAALLAAAALAVAPVHVRDAHFATVDVLMTLFVALSLGFAVRIPARPNVAPFAMAGLFAGLAASSKYNAGLVVVAIVVAGILAYRETNAPGLAVLARRLALSGASALLAFAATSPFVVLRFRAFAADMSSLSDFLYERPHAGLALWTHLRITLPFGLGVPFFLLALTGLALSLRRRSAADLVLLSFVLPFFALIAGVRIPFPRYVVPLVPGLAVLAAVAAVTLAKRFPLRSRKLGLSIAAVLLLVPGLVRAALFDRLAARDDTRVLAASWIAGNLGPQTRVAVCRGYGAPHVNVDRRRPPAFAVEEVDCTRGRAIPEGTAFLVTHEHETLSAFSRVHPELRGWLSENASAVARFDPYRRGARAEPFFYPGDAFYLPFTGLSAVDRGGPVVTVWRRGNETPE